MSTPAEAAKGTAVCSGKRTGHPGGDRRALELMPLRAVVKRNHREDVLECGHRLPNLYDNNNQRRHCPECPRLAEPLSEAARLRRQVVALAEALDRICRYFEDCDMYPAVTEGPRALLEDLRKELA